MDPQQAIIERIIQQALAVRTGPAPAPGGPGECRVPVGVSNRHVHLGRTDLDALFGPGATLTRKKAMKQPGQFAAEETVTLRGPKGELARVRVLGPVRSETQVEVSVADGFVLGLTPPLRMSGDLEGTPGVELVGPRGRVQLEQGLMVARRHLHLLPATAARLGLAQGQEVELDVAGPRGGVLGRVVVRVADASATELHLDVEEANAFGIKNDDQLRLRRD
jgi:propanediol utilization protein